MADFLNHLIQRSGVFPAEKDDTVLLQPRLASLFETPRNVDEGPVSQSLADSVADMSLSPAQILSSDQVDTQVVNSPSESLAAAGFVSKSPENSPKNAVDRKLSTAPGTHKIEPEIQPDRSSTSNVTQTSTGMPSATNEVAPLKSAYIVQSRQSRVASRIERRELPETTSASDLSAPRGKRETLQRGQVFSDRVQADESLNGPVGAKQPAADGAATRQVIRPRVESVRPDSASASAQTTATSLLNERTVTEEKVVQIRIGRIDVHAAQPPAPVQPVHTTAPQPKMTLEEYLRRRENQR